MDTPLSHLSSTTSYNIDFDSTTSYTMPKALNYHNNNKNISLFPYLDTIIHYLPCHILTQDRNNKIHIPLIAINIAFIVSTTIWWCYNISGSKKFNAYFNSSNIAYTYIMFITPSLIYLSRLYFFVKHFQFGLWCNQNTAYERLMGSNSIEYSSFLMKQSPNIKTQLRKRIRFQTSIVLFAMITVNIFMIVISVQSAISQQNDSETRIAINDYYLYLIVILQYLIMGVFYELPNFAMFCVIHIYFIECFLMIRNFKQEFKAMTLEDILHHKLHEKYISMYDTINEYQHYFLLFIAMEIIYFSLVIWYAITLIGGFSTDSSIVAVGLQMEFEVFIYFSIFNIGYSLAFVLLPAFQMTEEFQELLTTVDGKIGEILKKRISFTHPNILPNLMQLLKIMGEKKEMKGKSILLKRRKLVKYLGKWNEQQMCLEILNRLLSYAYDQSCAFQMFGLQLDRYSIRNFCGVLLFGKLLTILWKDIE